MSDVVIGERRLKGRAPIEFETEMDLPMARGARRTLRQVLRRDSSRCSVLSDEVTNPPRLMRATATTVSDICTAKERAQPLSLIANHNLVMRCTNMTLLDRNARERRLHRKQSVPGTFSAADGSIYWRANS